jgi:hypothetical protein
MPLWKAHKNTKANRQRVVSHNIREMRRAGYSQKQSVAAALSAARGKRR